MDIVYRLNGIVFEWDAEKAHLNLEKHGVAFEEAAEVFFDPFYKAGDATPSDVAEQRDFLLGYSARLRLILVVHTERGPRTRIISARPATRAEKRVYESA